MSLHIALKKRFFTTFMLATALLVATFSFANTANAQFLDCAISGANIGDCLDQASEDQTSFTGFEGGLTAPSEEGYSPGLTQATTAREFIINTTNFVLGFLGLIAVVVIIYGGFLYVTAAGEEERATKGKKSLTYAVIGIVLILASFAIVNTLLVAPSDEEANLQGAAPGEGPAGSAEEQQAARRALFNLAGAEVNTVAQNFATAYQNYEQINIDIDELLRVPEPQVADDLYASLRQKLQILETIKQLSGQFSQVNEAVQPAINVINGYLQLTPEELAGEAEPDIWSWDPGSFNEFKSQIDNVIGGPSGLHGANSRDFALAVVEANERIQDLRERIERSVDLLQLNDVRVAFDNLTNELNSLASGSTESGNATLEYVPGNADLLRIFNAMAELSEAVQDILFIHTVINADVTEGNAPLIVRFDGLQSLDPLNRTISADAYNWDFGDAGTKPSGISGLNVTEGPSVLHAFTEPGTYVVRLMIEAPPQASPEEPAVADGLGIMRITVRPPATKINLEAQIPGQDEPFPLRYHNPDTGNLLVDTGVLKVTPGEASAGITFDASGTTTGGEANRIQSVRWSFGDNTPELFFEGPSSVELTQTKEYTEEGNYTMVVEITDLQGNVDRKLVNVVVASPIARMRIDPGTNVFVNEQFTLDASPSASEGGQINSYEWNPSNAEALEVEGPTDFETYKARYLQPGINNIELVVTDTLTGEDATNISIVVESKAPEAQFKYESTRPNTPSVYSFDGTLSYDPDGEDDLTYEWIVNGQESGQDFDFVEGTDNTSPRPRIKFNEKGNFTVSLTAIDPDGFGPGVEQQSEPFEQEIVVDNILDVTWGANDDPSAQLEVDEETGEASADVTLNLLSENAVAYEIDWGDEETEAGQMTGSQELMHTYNEAGTFVVNASVFDEEDEENTIARKIYISSSDTPAAVAGVSVNGEEVFDTTETIEINRTDTVTFDASDSLNTDGTGRRLSYSWDFGNGQRSTQETVNQQYREIGSYEVTLRVTNTADVSQVSPPDTINIEVVGEPPILRSITAVPTSADLTAPVTVQLNAVGAEDPDGRISRYRWWYYDPNNDTDELGVQVTTTPSANVTIGTRGEEGEEKTYKFAVEMTDDENNSISSRELISEDRTATLTITNGPNKAPTASFTVDRTSVFVGDTVNFSSSSTDPDGQVVAYFWDFEGDGFANNTENLGSNVSHTFTEGAPDGIRVRLKVRDNNESEAVSDAVTIYVDAIAQDPEAAFTSEQVDGGTTMQFTDNSTADEPAGATLAGWSWDFDVTVDSDGDGQKDNDQDSTDQNPSHDYGDYGIYRARLVVEDSEGSTNDVTNFVNVKAPATPTTPATQQLDARLLSTPPASASDNRIHLPGTAGNITFDYSTSVGDIEGYVIDKNVYFDTNGNGIPGDDEDHTATTPGQWTTNFDQSWGNIRVRLTVIDSEGNTDSVDKDVVFDGSPQPASTSAGGSGSGSGTGSGGGSGAGGLGANIFAISDLSIPAVLVTAAGFGILSLSRKRLRKNK